MISTKFGLSPNVLRRMNNDASFKDIIREAESSLMNLNTDVIDFYFIHWPDPNTPISETMTALNLLKKEGKIRFIGVSNFSKEQIIEAQKYGQIDVQQPPFSMVNQHAKNLMKWGLDNEISSFTYGSLGSGILSGAIRKIPSFSKDDIRLNFYDFYKEPKFSKIQRLLEVMDSIAHDHNRPVSQVAINWSTQNELVATALIGVIDAKQAIENCDAFDWSLSEDEIKMLNNKINAEGLDE